MIIDFEINLERRIRKFPWIIPMISYSIAVLLLFAILKCLEIFQGGHYWSILPAGLLIHSFFIIIIHDGAHYSITRTKFDRLVLNIGAGLILLPFFGEPFRKFHLIHHQHTNSDLDPLWSSLKKTLFTNRRLVYILCETVPFIFTLYIILKPDKTKSTISNKKHGKDPTIGIEYLLFSVCISVLVIYFIKPSFGFVIGSIFTLNLFSKIRHWCEHVGTHDDLSSNTFWFPLGMGIGNHDTHHHAPNISWFVLYIGLFVRKKTTNILKTIIGIFFNKSYVHYKKEVN